MKSAIALVSRHLRTLLAVAVLVVPVAVVAPGYLRGEVRRANGNFSAFAPPYAIMAGQYDARLAAGVVARVPAHASLGTVGVHLGTDSARWMAYVIAPRELTSGRAKWTIVFGRTPQQAHLRPVHAWRYGRDWLVER